MKARAVKGIILREIRREKMALFWVLTWITLLGIWSSHNPPITVDLGVVYYNESAAFTAKDVVAIMENITIDGVHIFLRVSGKTFQAAFLRGSTPTSTEAIPRTTR